MPDPDPVWQMFQDQKEEESEEELFEVDLTSDLQIPEQKPVTPLDQAIDLTTNPLDSIPQPWEDRNEDGSARFLFDPLQYEGMTPEEGHIADSAYLLSQAMVTEVSDAFEMLAFLDPEQSKDFSRAGRRAARQRGAQYVRDSWEAGNAIMARGHLGLQKMMNLALEDPDLDARIARATETIAKMQGTEVGKFWKIIGSGAQLAPFMLESMSHATWTGLVVGGFGFLLGGAAGGLPGAVATGTAAFKFGAGAGAFVHSAKVAGGNLFLDMIDSGIDPKIARAASLGAGVIIGAMEVVQLGQFARAIPGLRKIFSQAAADVTQDAVRRGTMRVIAEEATRYGMFVATESLQEGAQEVVGIAGEEIGRNLTIERLEQRERNLLRPPSYSSPTGPFRLTFGGGEPSDLPTPQYTPEQEEYFDTVGRLIPRIQAAVGDEDKYRIIAEESISVMSERYLSEVRSQVAKLELDRPTLNAVMEQARLAIVEAAQGFAVISLGGKVISVGQAVRQEQRAARAEEVGEIRKAAEAEEELSREAIALLNQITGEEIRLSEPAQHQYEMRNVRTMDEFKAKVAEAMPNIPEEQIEAEAQMVEAHARSMNMTGDEWLQLRFAPEDLEGYEPVMELWAKFPSQKQTTQITEWAIDQWGAQDATAYIQRFMEFAALVKRREESATRKGVPGWALQPNSKTLMSIDVSSMCPHQTGEGGAAEGDMRCIYCYLYAARLQAEMILEGGEVPPMRGKREIERNIYESSMIRDMPQEVVDWHNANAGIRMHSFGDYLPSTAALVDQIIADATERGLKIKAITKQKAFVDRYGDHPNVNINISTDFQHATWYQDVISGPGLEHELKGALSLAPTIEEAVEWQAGRENIEIRYVAINVDDALQAALDDRVGVVTMYHGPVRDNFLAIAERMKPDLKNLIGPDAFTEFVGQFTSPKMDQLDKMVKSRVRKVPGKPGYVTVNIKRTKANKEKGTREWPVVQGHEMHETELAAALGKLKTKACCQTGFCGSCLINCAFKNGQAEGRGAQEALKTFFQIVAGEPIASVQMDVFGKTALRVFSQENADIHTLVHEMNHMFIYDLADEDIQILSDHVGVPMGEWTPETHEQITEMLTDYMESGKAPAGMESLFQRFKEWLSGLYRSLRGDLQLTPEVRGVFDSMFVAPAGEAGTSVTQPGTRVTEAAPETIYPTVAERKLFSGANMAETTPATVDRIENIHIDYHSGQNDFIAVARNDKGEDIGSIEYSEFEGDIHINMMKVAPENRRQGIATQLMDYIERENPGAKVKFGLLTEEGEAFRKSRTPADATAPAMHQQLFRGANIDTERIAREDAEAEDAGLPTRAETQAQIQADAALHGTPEQYIEMIHDMYFENERPSDEDLRRMWDVAQPVTTLEESNQAFIEGFTKAGAEAMLPAIAVQNKGTHPSGLSRAWWSAALITKKGGALSEKHYKKLRRNVELNPQKYRILFAELEGNVDEMRNIAAEEDAKAAAGPYAEGVEAELKAEAKEEEQARRELRPHTVPKEKETVKHRIRRITGQVPLENYVRMDQALEHHLSELEKIGDKARKAGDMEGYRRAKAQTRAIEQRRREDNVIRERRKKVRSNLERVLARAVKKKSPMDPRYKAEIQGLLEGIDLVERRMPSTITRLENTRDYLRRNPEETELPQDVIDELDILDKTPLGKLSLEQLEDLGRAVLHAEHLDRTKRSIMVDRKKRTDKWVREQAISELKEPPPDKPPTGPQEPETIGPARYGARKVKDFFGIMHNHWDLIVERVAGPTSTFFKVVYRDVKAGIKKQYSHRQKAFQRLREDLKSNGFRLPMEKLRGWLDQKEVAGGWKLARGQRISFYLHSLNEDSRESILKGGFGFRGTYMTQKIRGKLKIKDPNRVYHITEENLDAIANSLTEDELAFAASVQALFARQGKDIGKVFQARNGFDLDLVDNYIPIQRMPVGRYTGKDLESEEFIDSFKERFTRVGAPKGMVQERQGVTNPIYINDIAADVNKSVMNAASYIGLEIPLTEASRLFYHPEFKQEFIKAYGDQAWKEIDMGLRDIAGQYRTIDELQKFWAAIRRRVAVFALGLNPWVALKQVLSLAHYGAYIDAKYLIRGIWDEIVHPIKTKEKHLEWSAEYTERIEGGGATIETGEISSRSAAARIAGEKRGLSEWAMVPIQYVDKKAVSAGMRAAVLQVLHEMEEGKLSQSVREALNMTNEDIGGLSEQDRMELAYEYADWATERTQPMFAPEHQSRLQRSKGMKMFTMFSSFVNQELNLLRRSLDAAKRGDPKVLVKTLGAVVINFVGAAVLDLGRDIVRDPDKPNKEELLRDLFDKLVDKPSSWIFLLRDFEKSAMSKWRNGTWSGQDIQVPVMRFLQEGADMVAHYLSAIENRKNHRGSKELRQAIDSMIELFMMSRGLPYSPKKAIEESLDETPGGRRFLGG